MSSTEVVIVPGSRERAPLPALDSQQRQLVDAALERDLIFRALPGGGKTTVLLSVVQKFHERGTSVVVLAPDRQRAQQMNEQVRDIMQTQSRPVKTPVSFAYSLVDAWRNRRSDPLGGVELVTGAQEDAQIADFLSESIPQELHAFCDADSQAPAMLRMELRNLVSTAQRLGVSPEELQELGTHHGFEPWVGAAKVYAAMQKDPQRALHWRGSMRVTHAEVERLAANLVSTWKENEASEKLTSSLPLPEVLVVDDLQDMTVSTVHFLSVLSQHGVRIVAASEPDVSVATFRGAMPQADILLARLIETPILECGGRYRGTKTIQGMVGRVTQFLTQAGPGQRRNTISGMDADESEEELRPVRLMVGQTTAQMGAHIARHIRENYLFRGMAWEDHVVIVRSQSQIDELSRQLKRFSVPVDTHTSAFRFMAEPATRMLLRLLLSAPLHSHEDSEKVISELIASAYVGLDPVDLYRLLRAYVTIIDNEESDSDTNSHTVGTPHHTYLHDIVIQLIPDHTKTLSSHRTPVQEFINTHPALQSFNSTLEHISLAARMWQAARTSTQLRPRQALWNVWEQAAVAQEWQKNAVENSTDASWYDTQLDAVVALFRVADIWEQRNPSGTSEEFAQHIATHDIPIDTLSQHSVGVQAVRILTPAQAAGAQWPVVIVAGAHDGQWPNSALRHHMLHADALENIISGSLLGADEQNWNELTDPRRIRHHVRDDEYRLFVNALSRATQQICYAVVLNEDSAPSELITRALGTNEKDRVETGIERDFDGRVRYRVQPAPSPLDESGVIGDLRYWATKPQLDSLGNEEDENEEQTLQNKAIEALAILTREGIPSAHPLHWKTPGALTTDQPLLGHVKPSISPSAVERIETCPLRWFGAHIGADSRPAQAASRGTFIHSLAEEHQKNPEQSVTDLYLQRWDEYSQGMEDIEKRSEKEAVENCVNGLQSYFDALETQACEGAKVEEYIQYETQNYTIRGMIDRLEPHGDKWRIVDFKTGNPKTQAEAQVDPQLQTYQFALQELGYEIEHAQLQYLKVKGKKTQPAHVAGQRVQTALSVEEHEERRCKLEEDVQLMNASTFEARKNDYCAFCSIQPICPAWNTHEGENA